MEKSEVNKVIKFINGLPDGEAIKFHGGLHRRGEPDVFACINGRCVLIEMKFGRGKGGALQKYRVKCWSFAGALAFFAWSLNDVKMVLEKNGYI